MPALQSHEPFNRVRIIAAYALAFAAMLIAPACLVARVKTFGERDTGVE